MHPYLLEVIYQFGGEIEQCCVPEFSSSQVSGSQCLGLIGPNCMWEVDMREESSDIPIL